MLLPLCASDKQSNRTGCYFLAVGFEIVGAVYESVNKLMKCVNQANNPLLTEEAV
jgi:hypothetical protein